ncbi:MAG: hypothetical protein J7L99_05900, partial [Planctomycetes bacterium]|nr:hypothetical protein [Planctomycetota bacterium]
MTHRRCFLQSLIVLIFVGVCSNATAAQKGVPKRPIKPHKIKEGDGIEDSWLATILFDELKQAVSTHNYDELCNLVDKAILARLSCGHVNQLETLTDMIYIRRACRYLALADTIGASKDFADWLFEHRDIARRMFRALQDVKSPEECLRKLGELVKARPKKVLEYP